ncbi:MAG: hypothetical protein K5666_00230 [Bacilli bacterium]|nr:hypothetical protein [Bacilli bacterium]
MKKVKIIGYIIGLLLMGLLYYIILPPINPSSILFWFYIGLAAVVNSVIHIGDIKWKVSKKAVTIESCPKHVWIPFLFIPAMFIIILIVNVAIGPVFNSRSWANRIEINTGVFSEEIAEVDFNKIPLLDKDSSQKLGDRTMGQMNEYVSQYYVSSLYTQINYNDEIIRVTPIEYDGLIKWITNRKNGINAYITVNSVDGASKLVKMDKGMKYMPSAYFGEDLERKLRFSYPFDIFGTSRFEIDNEGKPYWITPVIKYTGFSRKEAVVGAIILDPVTGESKKYDLKDVPDWVDNVFYADLVIEQVNDWGEYQGGFFNSIFGQKNVVNTTEGYNYLALNDDIYLYTGITSVSSDESNLGFILTNLRTGKTTYYEVPGAEEYSAMDSAKGQVQQMNYTSTFPLLINLNGRPTYLVSLKDNAGLVKMYAFIDVQDYQKVVVTDASEGIQKAAANYLSKNGTGKDTTNNITKKIIIKSINNAVLDGNSYYYIVDTEGKKYIVSIKVSNLLPYIKEGSKVVVSYYQEDDFIEISSISTDNE